MKDNKRKALVLSVATQLCKTENRLSTRKLKLEMRNQYPTEMWNQYHDGKNKGVTEYFHELVREGKFVSIANNGTYQTYASANLPIVSRKGDTYIPDAEAETAPQVKTGTLKKLVKAIGKSKASKPAKKTATKAVTKKKAVKKAVKTAVKVVKRTSNHNVRSINKTAAAALITQVTGRFGTAEFIKQDGTLRKMNFRYSKDQTMSVLGYVKVIDIALYNAAKKTGLTKDQAEKKAIRNINLQTLKSISANGVKNNVR